MLDPSLLSPMATPESSNPWTPLETKDCSQGFCSIYCPHWCYIVFPPPPPPFKDDGASSSPTFSPLVVIAVIGILASAFVLVSYYAIISKFCSGSLCHRQRRRQQRQSRRDEERHIPLTVGLDRASINKIPIRKYKRGGGSAGCSDCSVCLREFREDESLRVLPKCSHAFHVRCIDTWLKSHSNCPLCRASIVFVTLGPPKFLPEGVQRDETVVAIRGSDEGTSSSLKEVDEIGQRMRRSFSTGSLHQSRVPVNIEDDDTEIEDHEILVGGSSPRRSGGEYGKKSGRSSGLHCVGLVPMRRSVSSGRLTHSVLTI